MNGGASNITGLRCQKGIRNGSECIFARSLLQKRIHVRTAAAAAKELYLPLIVLWRLGGTACIRPDSGPSQLHPIAIHQYWSFFAEHGQL
jgi:hypothetical protein